MKLQVTVLLFCIAMVAARPGCGGRYGKRSPGCHGNRNAAYGGQQASYGGQQAAGGVQGRSGRAATLQSALTGAGLTTLLALVEQADLVGALTGDSDLTVMAPTNEALKTFIDSLPSAPDTATVKKVLLNHVISGAVPARVVATLDGKQAENLDGNKMTVRVNGKTRENPTGITVGGARVAKVDIPVLRLTVHVLDDVINPFELNTVQEGLNGLRLTTLLSLLQNADLVGALNGPDDLTLFAPTNKALDTFIKSLPSAPDAATVKKVLLNHVISGKALSSDITDGLTVKNLDGNDMSFKVTGNGVTIGGARIARTDIVAGKNGKVTIHVLDDVINPFNL